MRRACPANYSKHPPQKHRSNRIEMPRRCKPVAGVCNSLAVPQRAPRWQATITSRKPMGLSGSRQPLVISTKVGINAHWYRVRVTADDRDMAEKLCKSLQVGGQLSGSAGLMFASRFGAPCIRDRRRRTRLTTRHTCVAGTEGLTFPNRRLPAETRTHARVGFNASTTPACLKVCRPGLGSDDEVANHYQKIPQWPRS